MNQIFVPDRVECNQVAHILGSPDALNKIVVLEARRLAHRYTDPRRLLDDFMRKLPEPALRILAVTGNWNPTQPADSARVIGVLSSRAKLEQLAAELQDILCPSPEYRALLENDIRRIAIFQTQFPNYQSLAAAIS